MCSVLHDACLKAWLERLFYSLCAGSVLRCEVLGRLQMKCYLSDMPELRLGLNDKQEDVTFHQCVNLATYDNQRVVTFTPPDGEFEVMRWVAPASRAAPSAAACCTSPLAAGTTSFQMPP